MEYRKLVDVEIRDYDREALDKSWEWLNDPEMKTLTMTPDFDRESQEKWFNNLKNRQDYHLKAGWHDGAPVAIYGLKNISETDAEIFGYVGDKNMWGKTVAIPLMVDMFDMAKSRKLKSLYCITLKDNTRTRRLCSRFGFEVEKDIDCDKVLMRVYL